MVNRVLQPQEVEVYYVLPTLRRELAITMKKSGKSQKEIAKLLGVTEPAISQYISSKRASIMKLNDVVKKAVSEAAKRITDETSLMRETQRLLQLVRDERLICKLHESFGNIPVGCKACFE